MSQPLPIPPLSESSLRVREIVAEARALLDESGWDAVTMRGLAERLGIRAPSLYKHVASKEDLRVALTEQALVEMGTALHAAAASPGTVAALLAAYRSQASGSPALYRLSTTGDFPRDRLAPGLEEWAGTPFWLVTQDPHRAQALWACAHGLASLEIDQRVLPETAHLFGDTWAAAAAAFAPPE